MWNFASNAIASLGLKKNCSQSSLPPVEDSDDDDDVNSESSKEEGLECPICWESFNIVENVPYVLWCGHSICKNCVLGLQCASVKMSNQKIQVPFFISCPWCHLLSLRLVYRGNLNFPRKNYFLLWMIEGLNGDRVRSHPSENTHPDMRRTPQSILQRRARSDTNGSNSNARRRHAGLNKPWDFFIHLATKLLLLLLFLLIVLFVVPASAAVLATYLIITVIFAVPSLLILYFAYPAVDWLHFFSGPVSRTPNNYYRGIFKGVTCTDTTALHPRDTIYFHSALTTCHLSDTDRCIRFEASLKPKVST